MFQNIVKSATFPVIWEALNAIDNEMDGVQKRLEKIIAKSEDDITKVVAKQQVTMLQVWRPMIDNLVDELNQQHTKTHGTPPPKIRKKRTRRR